MVFQRAHFTPSFSLSLSFFLPFLVSLSTLMLLRKETYFSCLNKQLASTNRQQLLSWSFFVPAECKNLEIEKEKKEKKINDTHFDIFDFVLFTKCKIRKSSWNIKNWCEPVVRVKWILHFEMWTEMPKDLWEGESEREREIGSCFGCMFYHFTTLYYNLFLSLIHLISISLTTVDAARLSHQSSADFGPNIVLVILIFSFLVSSSFRAPKLVIRDCHPKSFFVWKLHAYTFIRNDSFLPSLKCLNFSLSRERKKILDLVEWQRWTTWKRGNQNKNKKKKNKAETTKENRKRLTFPMLGTYSNIFTYIILENRLHLLLHEALNDSQSGITLRAFFSLFRFTLFVPFSLSTVSQCITFVLSSNHS